EDQDLFGTQPMVVGGELSGRFQLAEDMSEFQLSDGRLGLDLSRAGASGEIELGFAMSARNLLEEPSYQGELRLSPLNPRALMAVLSLPELETQSLRALTRVAFSTRFSGDTNQVRLEPVNIELDETRINGHLAVTDLSRTALDVVLKGDRIDVDGYLP